MDDQTSQIEVHSDDDVKEADQQVTVEGEGFQIPDQLPILPLRGVVVYPGAPRAR